MSEKFTKNENSAISGQHWLILAHCFNMDGRAASQTITDKLPHLIKKGVKLSVISGISGSHDQRFPHFQLLPWGPSGLRFDLRHLVAMRFGRGKLYRIIGLLVTIILAPLIIIERLLFGLQSHASWVFPAMVRALWLIWKQRPEVIYSTGGVYAAHWAGCWLKKLTGITWIAEIHDPMVIAGAENTRNERRMAKLEGDICRHADLVWWFTEGALNSARQRHPELEARGVVILPGVARLSTDARYQRGQQMIIGHFGSLSNTRSLLPIVQAVATLIAQQPEVRIKLRVHVYGGNIDAPAIEEIARQGLGDVFICFGRLEKSTETGQSGREQVIDLMHQVDCLLMVHGNIADCSEYIPSKLYEYFWAGRPIIALPYKNPQLERMLAERNCYIAESDNPDEIVATISAAYDDYQQDNLRQSSLPGIGTEQAVDAILEALE
jgi:hypothetical protein